MPQPVARPPRACTTAAATNHQSVLLIQPLARFPARQSLSFGPTFDPPGRPTFGHLTFSLCSPRTASIVNHPPPPPRQMFTVNIPRYECVFFCVGVCVCVRVLACRCACVNVCSFLCARVARRFRSLLKASVKACFCGEGWVGQRVRIEGPVGLIRVQRPGLAGGAYPALAATLTHGPDSRTGATGAHIRRQRQWGLCFTEHTVLSRRRGML